MPAGLLRALRLSVEERWVEAAVILARVLFVSNREEGRWSTMAP